MADDKLPTAPVKGGLSTNINHLKTTLESWRNLFMAIGHRHHNCSYVP